MAGEQTEGALDGALRKVPAGLDAKVFAGQLAVVIKAAIAKAADPLNQRIVDLEKRIAEMERRESITASEVQSLLER